MNYDYYKETKKKASVRKFTVIFLVAFLFTAVLFSAGIYLHIIQLDEIGGYSKVFYKNFKFQVLFFIISFVIIFGLFTSSLLLAKKNINEYFKGKTVFPKKIYIFIISGLSALIGGMIAQNSFYLKALSFINYEDFGKMDPIFGKDIGYYVFKRPFLISIYDFAFYVWLFVIIATAFYYLFYLAYSNFYIDKDNVQSEIKKFKSMLRHNIINISILFFIKTFSYQFQKQEILFSNMSNGLKGGGFIGVNIWMNYYKFIPFVLIFIIVFSLIFTLRGNFKKAAVAISIFPVIGIIISIISYTTQVFVVAPNQFNKEKDYIKFNIEKTREAYKLNDVKTHNFPAIKPLTPEVINRNIQTKNNIRIVHYDSTLDSNIQLQRNTNFYTFADGDVINYDINGVETPIFITAREIDKNQLPDKNYINVTYKFTHGYGVVINPQDKVTSEGQIDFILSGLRMDSIDPKLKITEPRIYYGELTKDMVIVNAANGMDEVDYDGNTVTRYKGKGGIKLSLLNRILFSLKYADFNMLISGYVSNDSKILLNRQVIDRAKKALPFLHIDSDPCIILTDDGRLKWVLDAYTTTSKYPYAQNYENINYIRNSAKIVVDAYDGDVKCYIIDNTDPIIRAYNRIYPGVLISQPLPAEISQHIRYPEYLFRIQTEMLKKYHLQSKDVVTFFSQNDLWEIAKYSGTGKQETESKILPYYNMIKLPGNLGKKEELILMRPFTPSNEHTDNMVSWLAVRNSYKNYGEMILFKFPKNTNIFGPNQIDIKINQIDKISKDMSLWDQRGSSSYKGDLLVIPIEDSVLYVQPIYIRSHGETSIPEMREIVVGYQSGNEFKYGIGNTLDLALNDLFNKKVFNTTETTHQQSIIQPQDIPNKTDPKILEDILSKYNAIKKELDDMGKLIEGLR